MDKIFRLTLLIDFYGDLLTGRQKEVIESYYFDNLSLAEIAERNGVSSQSVSDLLKRTEKILEKYEMKLKLVESHIHQKDKARLIVNIVDRLISDGRPELDELKKALLEIL